MWSPHAEERFLLMTLSQAVITFSVPAKSKLHSDLPLTGFKNGTITY